MAKNLVIKNASEHNLKKVSLSIPRNSFTVFTGISGSGKSSLAFDTIFKEGQRRYLASLSAYARQFMQQMEKPEVDLVEGLSPTICIDQKTAGRNPRSTVGTITEIYDFLRLLFSRLGVPECPHGHGPISGQAPEAIVDHIASRFAGRQLFILAPLIRDRKGEYRKELKDLRGQGFKRARIDGEIRRLDEDIVLERYEKHTIEVAMDYLTVEDTNRVRLEEAVFKCVEMSGGLVTIQDYEQKSRRPGEYALYTTQNACSTCGASFPEMEPRLFSFNAPQGMCSHCQGLGYYNHFSTDLLVRDGGKPLFEGALHALNDGGNVLYQRRGRREILRIARQWKVDVKQPWDTLPRPFRERIFKGKHRGKDQEDFSIIQALENMYRRYHITMLERYMEKRLCYHCRGRRLNDMALSVKFRDRSIIDFAVLQIKDLNAWFARLELWKNEVVVGEAILKEILERLAFLQNVGLEYLTLDRRANTLSGGEAQRIRLASQVGSGLEGCLYIMDEPSIGLHQSDNKKLIETLKSLRNRSNTVYIIEHDEETMLAADHLVDVGTGAGREGGEIVFNGAPSHLIDSLSEKNGKALSHTLAYLTGEKQIFSSKERKPSPDRFMGIRRARKHNLKDVSLDIPQGLLVAVTGVSGSGKSTLIFESLEDGLNGKKLNPQDGGKVIVKGKIDKIVEINQKPIGRTPRSNPATYTKAMDIIRDIFASTPEARYRGYKKGRFSFNVKGGRCEECGGAGVIQVDMQIFASNEVVCEICNGKRFNTNTLDIHYKGKNIYEVLEMSVAEAAEWFQNVPRLSGFLDIMNRIGLGYVKLGQPSTTLSGGEAQRVKLASELGKSSTGRTVYLLDEPTTGLHFQDIDRLLASLNELVDKGNTVIVIEHNLDVIKSADHVIEMGPRGGDEGGKILFQGGVGELAKSETPTGKEMKRFLDRHAKRARGYYRRPENFKKLLGGKLQRKNKKARAKQEVIKIKGLYKNNLKNMSFTIPKNKIVTITGVSGSGKTSLAFDTIFQEGQRTYIESLSTYARRFLGRLPRAKVDRISGISPTIAVDQKAGSKNPRSTLATQTEIYDCFRVLYANIGKPHCPLSGAPLHAHTPAEMARDLLEKHQGRTVTLLAPLWDPSVDNAFSLPAPGKILSYYSVLTSKGYSRLRMAKEWVRLDRKDTSEMLKERLKGIKSIELVIDRLTLNDGEQSRLIEGLEKGVEIGEGVVFAHTEETTEKFSSYYANFDTGYLLKEDITPKHFSFNHHIGACPRCQGIGMARAFEISRFINSPKEPLIKGAMSKKINPFFTRPGQYYGSLMKSVCRRARINLRTLPWEKLSASDQQYILYGSAAAARSLSKYSDYPKWKGIAPLIEELYVTSSSDHWREAFSSCLILTICPDCRGGRLDKRILAVKLGSRSIAEVCAMPIVEAKSFFEQLASRLPPLDYQKIRDVMEEINFRLKQLNDLGLHYLTLDRTMGTLSGGEVQRIRLASQIGNKLNDVIYVLDEPTIGLHERDTGRLLHSLRELRNRGNTVMLVEHDGEVIRASDQVIDLGPGAGDQGGQVMFAGKNQKIHLKNASFYPYLYGEKNTFYRECDPTMSDPQRPRLFFPSVSRNNIDSLDVAIPMVGLVGISGVSGSGKSSLMETIVERIRSRFASPRSLKGADVYFVEKTKIKKRFPLNTLIEVDQSPVSRSSRSTVASYMEIFNAIREIFSRCQDARERGFHKGYFSFNSPAGACTQCQGKGIEEIEMHFISDVSVTCDLCKGSRYRREVLEVLYKGLHIADILDLSVAKARDFFDGIASICNRLDLLMDTGLGYLKLGIYTSLLSGGELQRLKLGKELSKKWGNSHNLYVLDEPTTGLHFRDIEMLIHVLDRLVKRENTVVVIEHNREFLRNCDYLIDMGPEAGPLGGRIVAQGTVGEVKALGKGATHAFL